MTTSRAPAIAAAASSPCLRKGRAKASTDRKSTRLNSSHSQISYAVFCLKKKKKTKKLNSATDKLAMLYPHGAALVPPLRALKNTTLLTLRTVFPERLPSLRSRVLISELD